MTDWEFGVSTLLWYDCEDLVPHLPLLAEVGIGRVELRRLSPHVDHTDEAAMLRLAAGLRHNGLRVHSVHMPDGIISAMSSLDAAERRNAAAEAKSVAVAARKLGGDFLVTHAGGLAGNESERDQRLAASQESLAELAAFCRDIGLRVAVENALPTKPRLCDTAAELVRLVEGLAADNVGYCLDTGHASLGEDLVAAVHAVCGDLMTLHVSDNDGKSDQHAPPFTGVINWPAFIGALRQIGYAGALMMEVRSSADPAATLRMAKAAFERLTSPGFAPPHDRSSRAPLNANVISPIRPEPRQQGPRG